MASRLRGFMDRTVCRRFLATVLVRRARHRAGFDMEVVDVENVRGVRVYKYRDPATGRYSLAEARDFSWVPDPEWDL